MATNIKTNADIISIAVGMICKSVVLAAGWSGKKRKHALEEIAAMSLEEMDKEILFLRERVSLLETQVSFLHKQFRKGMEKPRYSIKERLFVVFHMEQFQLPRRRVTDYFGVARSTLYRWLDRLDDPQPKAATPANKTSDDIASLVWEIAKVNVDWGRVKSEYKALIRKWLDTDPRYGAIGKHGSIAVTERVIKTLRYEWLAFIPLIKGFDHLNGICAAFVLWYNSYRPHMTLNGFTPDAFYRRDYPESIPSNAKAVPTNIERVIFKDTNIIGYRLKEAA